MSDTVVNDNLPTTPDPALLLDGDAPRLGGSPTPPEAPNLPAPPPVAPVEQLPTLAVAPESPATLAAPDTPTLTAPAPLAPAAPAPSIAAPAAATPTAATPALTSPVLASDEAPILPASTPNVAPLTTESEAPAVADDDDEPRHPMAHLMPQKSKPTEASLRAAEIRAAQKAKGKKIKIGIAVGVLVFTALVGPPLFKWLSNAVNEAGDTNTEQTAD